MPLYAYAAVLALTIGLWRQWVGRGVDGWPSVWITTNKAFPGATYIQFAILIAGVTSEMMFLGHAPWNVGLTAAVGIGVLFRITGHTPILYPPGSTFSLGQLKGLEAFLWNDMAMAAHRPEIRWWLFGVWRYTLIAAIIQEAMILQHAHHDIALATMLMLLTYRITAIPSVDTFLSKHPLFYGTGHVQWAEMIGWSFYGVALAISY